MVSLLKGSKTQAEFSATMEDLLKEWTQCPDKLAKARRVLVKEEVWSLAHARSAYSSLPIGLRNYLKERVIMDELEQKLQPASRGLVEMFMNVTGLNFLKVDATGVIYYSEEVYFRRTDLDEKKEDSLWVIGSALGKLFEQDEEKKATTRENRRHLQRAGSRRRWT